MYLVNKYGEFQGEHTEIYRYRRDDHKMTSTFHMMSGCRSAAIASASPTLRSRQIWDPKTWIKLDFGLTCRDGDEHWTIIYD